MSKNLYIKYHISSRASSSSGSTTHLQILEYSAVRLSVRESNNLPIGGIVKLGILVKVSVRGLLSGMVSTHREDQGTCVPGGGVIAAGVYDKDRLGTRAKTGAVNPMKATARHWMARIFLRPKMLELNHDSVCER